MAAPMESETMEGTGKKAPLLPCCCWLYRNWVYGPASYSVSAHRPLLLFRDGFYKLLTESPGEISILLKDELTGEILEVEFASTSKRLRARPARWSKSVWRMKAADFPAGLVTVNIYCDGMIKATTEIKYYSAAKATESPFRVSDPDKGLCQKSIDELDNALAFVFKHEIPYYEFKHLQTETHLQKELSSSFLSLKFFKAGAILGQKFLLWDGNPIPPLDAVFLLECNLLASGSQRQARVCGCHQRSPPSNAHLSITPVHVSFFCLEFEELRVAGIKLEPMMILPHVARDNTVMLKNLCAVLNRSFNDGSETDSASRALTCTIVSVSAENSQEAILNLHLKDQEFASIRTFISSVA
uniref:B-cell scaffold protein with ankyrin repeats 1 n=1 Tax=Rattus norvegicus TaxID=10116 RepID=Q6TUE0_RAT|nr:LRRGT00104 [Rattus norvegicus]